MRGSRSAAPAGGRTRPGGMRAAGGGEGRRGVGKKAEMPVEPDEEMSGNVDGELPTHSRYKPPIACLAN